MAIKASEIRIADVFHLKSSNKIILGLILKDKFIEIGDEFYFVNKKGKKLEIKIEGIAINSFPGKEKGYTSCSIKVSDFNPRLLVGKTLRLVDYK